LKKYIKILALLVIGLMFIAGCSPKNDAADNNKAPATDGELKFKIYLAGSTPGGGGVWDMIGAGLAEAITRGNKGSSVTVVPGGGVSDVPVVSNGEAELGLTHSVIAVAGEKGIDPFKEKYTNVKGVVSLYTSQLQFMVNPKTGIEKITDIKEKKIAIRIAVGDPGSTGELATKRLLNAYGMTYEDIESWGGKVLFKDMGEAASMFGDGIIDAFTLLTLAPNGPLQQVATNKDVRMLPIDEDVIQKMVADYGYSEAIVPQSAYNFLEKDIPSFSSQVVLITSEDRSEQEIYQITKSLVENLDYIRSIHNNLKGLTEKNMLSTGVELHPGAAKYFREKGVL